MSKKEKYCFQLFENDVLAFAKHIGKHFFACMINAILIVVKVIAHAPSPEGEGRDAGV